MSVEPDSPLVEVAFALEGVLDLSSDDEASLSFWASDFSSLGLLSVL